MRPFDVLASTPLLDTPIFRVRQDRARHPESGKEADFVVLSGPNWVNVIALTDDGELVLIRQYRHGTRELEIEIPGGLIDPGEEVLAAAARELLEETGYRAKSLRVLAEMHPNPAFLENTCTTVVATGCAPEREPALDADEHIEVMLANEETVRALVFEGAISHGVVLFALLRWLAEPSRGGAR